MASSPVTSGRGSRILRSNDSLSVAIPVVKTTCQRYWEWIKDTTDLESKKGFITQLFAKQLLTRDEIDFSLAETLKELTIRAITYSINLEEASEKKNYIANVKNIFEAFQGEIELDNGEKILITDYLRAHYDPNYQTISKRSKLTRSRTPEYIAKDNRITPQMRQRRPPSLIIPKNPALLKKDQMQWLFRVLSVETETPLTVNSYELGSIRPDVFVLCYKAFTTTEDFLDAILEAINDREFSIYEREKTQKNLIDLLNWWLHKRYYIEDLSKEAVRVRFEAILERLSESEFEKVREWSKPLQNCYKNSLALTPRDRPVSFAVVTIDEIIQGMINGKETACKQFAYEIHCYYLDFITQMPMEQFFSDFNKMQETAPQLAAFTEGINRFEAWLPKQFDGLNERDKTKLAQSILKTMDFARENSDFQTIFSLLTALNKVKEAMNKVKEEKRKKKPHNDRIDRALETWGELCHPLHNFRNLRGAYQKLEDSRTEYLPLIGVTVRDLLFILQKKSVIKFGELKIFSIHRFDLLYRTVRPFIAMKKNGAGMAPESDLKIRIESELSQAASSSSGALDCLA